MDLEYIIILFVIWIAASVAVGEYARQSRGREMIAWFMVSMAISPVIALIVVSLMERHATYSSKGPFVKCRMCAEAIRREAKICRYCGTATSAAVNP